MNRKDIPLKTLTSFSSPWKTSQSVTNSNSWSFPIIRHVLISSRNVRVHTLLLYLKFVYFKTGSVLRQHLRRDASPVKVRVTQANSTVTNGSQVNPSTVSYKLFYNVDHSVAKFNKHEAFVPWGFLLHSAKKGPSHFRMTLIEGFIRWH